MVRSVVCFVCIFLLSAGSLRGDSYEPIGQAATEGAETAKKSLNWQKFVLITSIFAITVFTIVLVTQHNGKK